MHSATFISLNYSVFDIVRWDSLRATEGWAALQHHNLLHTTLKITPPARAHHHPFPWLSFSVRQASFFTLLPCHSLSGEPLEWHPGNIYAFPNVPKQLIRPPRLSMTEPTYYHLFVSGDYEVRLPLISYSVENAETLSYRSGFLGIPPSITTRNQHWTYKSTSLFNQPNHQLSLSLILTSCPMSGKAGSLALQLV